MKSIDISKLRRRETKPAAPALDIEKAVSAIHGEEKKKKATSRLTIDLPLTLREKIEEKRDGDSVKAYIIGLIKKDLNP